WGLWTEAKRQAETTRQMFEAQHRPYLSFRVEMQNAHPHNLRAAGGVRYFIGNRGSVPAVVTGFVCSLRHQDAVIAEQNEPDGQLSRCVFQDREEMGKPMIFTGGASRLGNAPLVVASKIWYRGIGTQRYVLDTVVEVHPQFLITTRHQFT